ncbi:MAG TPA: hypothetical protein VFC22_00060 [Solirubrobacteraceae bacterium]|nr:hypothetical protein [Solirubrobacteraceae bacterium]
MESTERAVARRLARPRRLRDVHPTRRGLVLAWWSFTATFALLRLLTWLIRIHAAGLGNVSAGGVHIHHYIWGILLLISVAIFGLVDRSPRVRSLLGLVFGIALALVVDEAALLIELKNVYWSGFGAVSVAIALILIGAAGSALVLTRSPHAEPSPAEVPSSVATEAV